MCSVILRIRPGQVLLAANRDERIDRPWQPPAEHWPGIWGGRDSLAGGTWLAVSRAGWAACVLNRPGTLGPAAGKRSRGELPLLALAAPDPLARAAGLDAAAYRPFHMLLAHAGGAWFLAGQGGGPVQVQPLPQGVSMVTSHPPNDLACPRIARHLPRFRNAPDAEWPALLADAEGGVAALNINPRAGFGTVSAAMVRLGERPGFDFAPGPPHAQAFAPVALG